MSIENEIDMIDGDYEVFELPTPEQKMEDLLFMARSITGKKGLKHREVGWSKSAKIAPKSTNQHLLPRMEASFEIVGKGLVAKLESGEPVMILPSNIPPLNE